MAGIALFVPSDEMYETSLKILEDKEHNVIIVKKINTEDSVKHAMEAISEGVSIIVARGRQAVEIKSHTNAIVEEIQVTAQELALLVIKAKKLSKKERPKIAIFYWGDMICDTSHFNEILNVDLVRYKLDGVLEWRNKIRNAVNEDIDVIIGGLDTLDAASQLEIPSVYLSTTSESLEISLKKVQDIYKMYLSKEYNHAQFNSMLVSSSSGIIKIDETGKILVVNHIMEEILGVSKTIGNNLLDVIKGIDKVEFEKVLSGELENYSTVLKLKMEELTVSIEPIKVENVVTEAIVAFNKINKVNMEETSIMQKQYLKGRTASISFDDIDKRMKDLRKVVEKAKIYAASASPILIEAVSGPELDMLTQGIHNYSMRKNAPFIAINLAGMSPEEQEKTLFGSCEDGKNINGAIENARYGTLVIKSIDKLTLQNQYKLITCIRNKYLVKNNSIEDIVLIDTRIIACSAKDLTKLREKFLFRSDLYFRLRSLRLRIPKLTDRKDDVACLLDTYIQKYMKQYSKYHILTNGAKRVLLEYQWQGNSIQLDAFCERMILTLDRRSITEGYVRALLEELYHTESSIYNENGFDGEILTAELYEEKSIDPFEDLLIRTLSKYEGNRTLTAKELKISTTTLWRKMKKYGLDEKF